MDKKMSQGKDFFEFLWNLYKTVPTSRRIYYLHLQSDVCSYNDEGE